MYYLLKKDNKAELKAKGIKLHDCNVEEIENF